VVGKKRLSVTVRVADKVDAEFLLDTGIGLTLISPKLAQQLGCQPSGEYKGKHLAGQEFVVPLTQVPALALGSAREVNAEVGIAPISGNLDGCLSLAFFKDHPFTIDYASGALVLETSDSLYDRGKQGKMVPLRVIEEDKTILAWVSLALPKSQAGEALHGYQSTGTGSPLGGGGGSGGHGGGMYNRGFTAPSKDPAKNPTVWAALDTGNEALILQNRYMALFCLYPEDCKAVEGTDEVGGGYSASSVKLPQPLHLGDLNEIVFPGGELLFEKSRHEAHLGAEFLSQYTLTIDLKRQQMFIR
jgi:hypothetical protein